MALGGTLGIALSAVFLESLHLLPIPAVIGEPVFSVQTFVGVLGALALVGLAAGLFPALRAARMEPVKALVFK